MKSASLFCLLAIALPATAQVSYDTIASGDGYSSAKINSRGDIAYLATSSTGATSAWRLPTGSSTAQKLAASGDSTSPFRTYGINYSSLDNGASYRVEIAEIRDPDLGEDGNVAFVTDFVIEPDGDEYRIRSYNNSAIWVTGDGTILSLIHI